MWPWVGDACIPPAVHHNSRRFYHARLRGHQRMEESRTSRSAICHTEHRCHAELRGGSPSVALRNQQDGFRIMWQVTEVCCSGVLVDYVEVLNADLSLYLHPLKRVGADSSGIGLAVPDGIDDGVVCSAKLERFEIPIGINAMCLELAPCHNPAAEGVGMHGQKALVLQISQTVDVVKSGPVKDHTAKGGVGAVGTEIPERCDTTGSVERLKLHVNGWVDEDEVYLTVPYSWINSLEIQWDDLE